MSTCKNATYFDWPHSLQKVRAKFGDPLSSTISCSSVIYPSGSPRLRLFASISITAVVVVVGSSVVVVTLPASRMFKVYTLSPISELLLKVMISSRPSISSANES